jgi:excisionase family DNA binding protein
MSSLTPQEAADLLGVTVKTLHRWEADGKIKSTRTVGGHRRYDIADLIGNKRRALVGSPDVKSATRQTGSQLEDLASDVLEIITVFSARLYGSRSHKNKKIVEELKEVAKQL